MFETYPFVYYAVGGGLVLLGLLTAFYVWNTCGHKCKQ